MSSNLLPFDRDRSTSTERQERRAAGQPPVSPFARDNGRERELNERQLAHRRRMLEHLRRQAFRAS